MSSDPRHVREQVDDYLHGLLPESEAERVESHCAECDECEAALEAARQRHSALTSLPPAEASQALIQATLDRIEGREQRRQQVWHWWSRGMAATAAATLLLLGGLTAYYLTLKPSPYDIRLLGQDQLLAGTQPRLRVAVFRQSDGRPVPDVPVTVQLRERNGGRSVQLASLRTGDSGTEVAALRLPEWEPGRYDLHVVADVGGRSEALTRPVRIRRDWKLMLTSDKPVYQPGQTIHLRALALQKPDLKPVAGREVTFQVEDPKGNLIFQRRTEASRFGIAHADCLLGSDIREGAYQVRCRVGDVESRLTLDVAKYVLPKFKVAVEFDKSYYSPGEEARVTVRAHYFFGQPVADAMVTLTPRTDLREGTPRTVTTDAQGQIEAALPVPESLVGLPQESGAARWAVTVEVTDSAGQTETVHHVRRVATVPFDLAVVPAGGTLVRDVPNPIYIQAVYPDGEPVDAEIQVRGQPGELLTDPAGVAAFELWPRADRIFLDLDARDDRGRRVRRRVELTAGGFQGDFLLLSDQAVYDGGETLQLSFRGGGIEPVFLDVLRDGQTVLTESVPMTEGSGQLDLDLPPDLFGPLRLVAYRFNRDGMAVRKSRMIFVRRASDLRIEAQLDRSEYRPGQRARLRLKLTDPHGEPVPGAVSLAAVDEAVFSVVRQRPGMERTFFQLDNELLQPLATIYGWSPFDRAERSPANRQRWEQSLFARTADAARGRNAVPVRLTAGGEEQAAGASQSWRPAVTRAAAAAESPDPHTLAAQSFPAKAAEVRRLQRTRLNQVRVAWGLAGLSFALLSLAALAYFRPLIFLATLALGVTGTCCVGVATFALLDYRMEMSAGGMAGSEARMPLEGAPGEAAAGVKTRVDFPETLLWRPELITDERGEAELDIDLADSITTWRLDAAAVSATGQLGGERLAIRVFQPFFVDPYLPVALTRGDEVTIPVVVYNYSDAPQTVQVRMRAEDWFEWVTDQDELSANENSTEMSDAGDGDVGDRDAKGPGQEPGVRMLELGPGEVRAVHFPIRAGQVGRHELEFVAQGGDVRDAIRREVEVVPNGTRQQTVASGQLDQPLDMQLVVPEDAVPGSAGAVVTLHPTTFSQVVAGLDSLLKLPRGCFEQTSSAAYPNVLVLRYLRTHRLNSPALEAKARQYIHVGYQRLIGFEVAGGGFDWFGNPPANPVLTAYGLMEFEDMAQVYDVDTRLIERTRDWLLRQYQVDGTWPVAERRSSNLLGDGDPRLATTAYIAWAMGRSGETRDRLQATVGYLLEHEPASLDDPYTLGLVINALVALAPDHPALDDYVARLLDLAHRDDPRRFLWWEQPEGSTTGFHGQGPAGRIETTAMATLALQNAGGDAAAIRGALHWLVDQKDASGNWFSTQATVLALQCLLNGSSSVPDEPRRFEVLLDGERVQQFDIPPDQLEVVQRVELPRLAAGDHRLQVLGPEQGDSGYHVRFQYWRETVEAPAADEILTIDLRYDNRQLRVNDVLTTTATVVNRQPQLAPMVMLDLPIPPGFAVERESLDALRAAGTIARYELTPRQILVYLRGLEAGEKRQLPYRLRATMPVKVAVPRAEVYEYYNPRQRGQSETSEVIVTDA